MTFLVWALAAASVAYWGMKIASTGPSSSVNLVTSKAPAADPAAIGRLLGQAPAGPAAAPQAAAPTRVQLVGVVADRSSQGVALLAVDGRPAKPYRVGSAVDDTLVLKSVQARSAVLAASADGPPVLTLELPLPPR